MNASAGQIAAVHAARHLPLVRFLAWSSEVASSKFDACIACCYHVTACKPYMLKLALKVQLLRNDGFSATVSYCTGR
jgi:hypothetical protein